MCPRTYISAIYIYYIYIHTRKNTWFLVGFTFPMVRLPCVLLQMCDSLCLRPVFRPKNDCNGRGLEAPGKKRLPQKPLVCEQREEPHSWHSIELMTTYDATCFIFSVAAALSIVLRVQRWTSIDQRNIRSESRVLPTCVYRALQMEFSGSWYGHAWLWLIQHKTIFQMVLNAAKPEYPMTHMVATLSKRIMLNYSNTM